MLLSLLVTSMIFIGGQQIEIKDVKPDFKVTKYTYTRENENSTDVMSPEPPTIEIIPMDFLCEFCQVVILKLKDRQKNEANFEQTIRDECLDNSDNNSTDSSLCDVINRVNLDRLRNDDPRKICEEQSLCKTAGSPAITPFQSVDSTSSDQKGAELDNQNVTFTMHVDDIAPPY